MNSTNLTASTVHTPNHHQHQHQQLNGAKEMNNVNSGYVKDRNAFVSTASKKTNENNKNGTIIPAKFNKNSFSSSSVGNVNVGHSSFGADSSSSTKNRRNAKSYNPDNHKKSYLPLTIDENHDDDVENYMFVESEEDGNDRNIQIEAEPALYSTVKSNLSYMPSRMDQPRNEKQQNFRQTMKRNLKSWSNSNININANDKNKNYTSGHSHTNANGNVNAFNAVYINNKKFHTRGSNGHKTNGDDIVNDMSSRIEIHSRKMRDAGERSENGDRYMNVVGTGTTNLLSSSSSSSLASSSRLLPTSTIKSMVTTSDGIASGENDHNHARDDGYTRKNLHLGNKNVEIGVAYLKSSGSLESMSIRNAISNNHLNNNNVMVDAYESPPTTMELECVAGYDGGLPQHFVLEAYDSRTKKLRLNITSALSDIPLFRIDLAGMFDVHL